MILVLDNRDSFTFNLVQALTSLGAEVLTRPADGLSLGQIRDLAPAKILIGPGPGHPREARLSLEILRNLGGEVPILGVCLGHQALALAFGGRVERAQTLVHGWTVAVHHDGKGLFRGIETPLEMARYNSLAVVDDSLPDCLSVSARDPEGEILALRHKEFEIESIQFHPESILSRNGVELLRNWIRNRVPLRHLKTTQQQFPQIP